MNFLAHLFLSGENEDIIFGNFIADAVKGKAMYDYSEDIQDGIRLHREIDKYTDHHPVFLESKKRLQPTYSKFSGVIVDLYYDHFLARLWDDYSEQELNSFVSDSYALLIRNFKLLPPRSKRLLPFMITQNWLVGYKNLYSMKRVFLGMSRRTSFNSGMENAIEDLQKDYTAYEDEFNTFFPDIIRHMEAYREKYNL